MIIDIVVSFFLLAGAAFALAGSIGLVRLPDFYSRLHGPTKATTLGVGSTLVASAIYFSVGPGTSLHEVLVTIFLFMTAPVSAHLLCKAALHTGVATVSGGTEAQHEDTTTDAKGT
ncbi:MAG TPA: Na+/H+ antiporter subunit G [Longimicrobiales bacterium]|nr:Na+/H+ antiporter subunit G [Longimicrobiales bacterium]